MPAEPIARWKSNTAQIRGSERFLPRLAKALGSLALGRHMSSRDKERGMGLFVDGVWHDTWYDTGETKGRFTSPLALPETDAAVPDSVPTAWTGMT